MVGSGCRQIKQPFVDKKASCEKTRQAKTSDRCSFRWKIRCISTCRQLYRIRSDKINDLRLKYK